MSVLNNYIITCRLVFQSNPDDAKAWSDIYKMISIFQQTLSCSFCSKLLVIPMISPSSECRHLYCRTCISKRVKLKYRCNICKSKNNFIEDTQSRILLQCHKKICEYIKSLSLHVKWKHLNSNDTSFHDLILEGAGLHDHYSYAQEDVNNCVQNEVLKDISHETTIETNISNGNIKESAIQNGILANNSGTSFDKNVYIGSEQDVYTDQHDDEPLSKKSKGHPLRLSLERPKSDCRRRCKCGRNALSARQICHNIRCPCFSTNKSCINCKCKGCKNPIDDEQTAHKNKSELSVED